MLVVTTVALVRAETSPMPYAAAVMMLLFRTRFITSLHLHVVVTGWDKPKHGRECTRIAALAMPSWIAPGGVSRSDGAPDHPNRGRRRGLNARAQPRRGRSSPVSRRRVVDRKGMHLQVAAIWHRHDELDIHLAGAVRGERQVVHFVKRSELSEDCDSPQCVASGSGQVTPPVAMMVISVRPNRPRAVLSADPVLCLGPW